MLVKSLLSLALAAFTLSPSFVSAQDEAFGPDNNRCIYAPEVFNDVSYIGSTLNATFDFVNQGTCGFRSDRASVWYKVLGIGEEATASVCTNNGVLTDFGVLMLCNSQKCQGFPPSELKECRNNEAVTYTWLAEEDVLYYVHVRSDLPSNFTVTVSGIGEAPPPPPTSAPGTDPQRLDASAGTTSLIVSFVAVTMTTLMATLKF